MSLYRISGIGDSKAYKLVMMVKKHFLVPSSSLHNVVIDSGNKQAIRNFRSVFCRSIFTKLGERKGKKQSMWDFIPRITVIT